MKKQINELLNLKKLENRINAVAIGGGVATLESKIPVS
jgi:hypothetical protein